MIDLHCHLLPGIDDGPATLAESLQLCRMAADGGTVLAIVTPHIHPGRWDNSREMIAGGCAALQEVLERKAIPLQLGYAGELRLTDRIMQQVSNDEVPFYGQLDGYNIMLLEFPHGHIIPGSEKLVSWLLSRRIRPLIAHPERNRAVMKDPGRLLPFIEAGCWLQVTAGSITGSFGEGARAIAEKLLQDDVVAVVASDGHNANARPPSLVEAFEQVSRRHGQARAERLMKETPAAIVASQAIEQVATV